MALLTPQQIAGIKDAIQTVTDTFFVTPVTYHLAGDSIDRFNEDRADQEFTDYNLKALVEFKTNESDKTTPQIDGAIEDYQVKLSFNYRDIIAANLHDGNNRTKMNSTKDYFTVHNRRFKVNYVGLDGPIEAENVLLIVFGVKEEEKS